MGTLDHRSASDARADYDFWSWRLCPSPVQPGHYTGREKGIGDGEDEGNGLLLLSKDQGLRQWTAAALEVGSSWLQPVLLLAKDRGLVSIEDYTKFIVDCLNRDVT